MSVINLGDYADMKAQRDAALDSLIEAKAVLNYVFYARLPLGDKVEEHIPADWWNRAVMVLGDKFNRS